MTRLRVVDAKSMERVLLALGFQTVRQKGSHVFYRHPDGRTTTILTIRAEILPGLSFERSYARLN